MIKIMRGLQIVATVTVAMAITLFVAAGDGKGPWADKYRETVKKTWHLTVGALLFLAWITCGLVARLMAPLDPRPAVLNGPQRPDTYKGAKNYLYRRSYRGRHYSGTPSGAILDALAA